ncbi:hypothetical protein EW146_g4789 [Bondarzewia mesenterica]|uniref:Uncharacterized protein n=1 Tax=Bondarzewia mesenterica TaxID=1095465 RepID=A0A4S4LU04_9AGAM|nr:hypothetical protein EW146_g4789 [Bondarzewia mesenterica]
MGSVRHLPVPEWPSLYNPVIEILDLEHHDPVEPNGRYLSNANDVFRFTFYWTVIFHAPLFTFCGIYAFLNIMFPPRTPSTTTLVAIPPKDDAPLPSPPIPLTPLSTASASSPSSLLRPASQTPRPSSCDPPLRMRRQNERRSRFTYAFLILLIFLTIGVVSALVESVVAGYILAGLYRSARFSMSTWVPFVWAFMIALTDMLGIFPSVVHRI